ncbi:hypothetical protein EYZ11_004721 [Aspergillus tanneri]|uniref:Amidase domain-containing protein n=1 Tax=Aspergillus tanneri TaxID=1220188 RepID=A0A4S3JQN9_9EURO|nr:hypothetical protein EYZ11_004721 [Aspergillus tanneri]
MTSSWTDRAEAKRSQLSNAIPSEWRVQKLPSGDSAFEYTKTCGILSPEELSIISSSATDLVSQLSTGKLRAVDVTLAFCKSAAIAQQLTNCMHEFFPEDALAQAKQLDQYYSEHKKPVGPLHGLPISLKDQLRVKGYETSMAYISWLGKSDEQDSILTNLLRKAGAVFYTKTSVPQTLMVCETINNIIGGSIRVPAAFNYLYGIRPSHGRLPYGRMANSMEGQETVPSVVGPIAHSAADIRLFMTAVLHEEPWKYDSKVIPMLWRSEEEVAVKKKIEAGELAVGFYKSDDNVLPHPPILRGVDMVVDALKRNGHKVVPWAPYKHAFAVDMANIIYAADGGTDVARHISASGEPFIPNIKELLNPDIKKRDLNEVWDVQLQKWNYQMEYLEKWSEVEQQLGSELDAIVAPVSATAAIRHNQFKYYGYATVFNVLDLTSVVVPVTLADRNLDPKKENYQPLNELDEVVQAEYDADAYHGAPVAIQVVGRRLSEEKTLAIAEEIGRLLGNMVTP